MGRAGGDSGTVRLVYARGGPEQAEPLVAVVGSEAEARDIEAEVTRRDPAVRVTWETHQVAGPPGEVVHVVLLVAGGAGGGEPADPIGIAVFARHEDAARELAAQGRPGGADDRIIRSLPLGWRRAGWPFSDEPAAPG